MKKFFFFLFMAYNISVNAANVRIGKRLYNYTDNRTALQVTRGEEYDYEGEITIPLSVVYEGTTYPITSIESGAFSNYSATKIILPISIKSIGSGAFFNCTNLQSISFPDGIQELAAEMCRGCESLANVNLNNIIVIKNKAFWQCKSLQSVEIPNSVTTIEDAAFRECGLVSLILPNNVFSIGSHSFADCTELKEVTFPCQIKIGDHAFYNCNKIEYLYSSIIDPIGYDISRDVFSEDTYEKATLYVPSGTSNKYKEAKGWSNFKKITEYRGIPPICTTTTMQFGSNTYSQGIEKKQIDLRNIVINNTYVNVDNSKGNDDAGYFDAQNSCLTINKTTSSEIMNVVSQRELGTEYVINNFTGIVCKIKQGNGSIMINAQTLGKNKLAVKIGNADAKTYTQAMKGDITVNYDVTEDTYVYIYANQQQSLSMDITDASDNAVKVHSITVTPSVTAIGSVVANSSASVLDKVYSIDGTCLSAPQKGINILKMGDGSVRKVLY